MSEDDHDGEAEAGPIARPSGRALAAVALGVGGLVLSVLVWAGWFLLVGTPSGSFGWVAYAPLRGSAPYGATPPLGGLGAIVALVLGACWFVLIPVSTVGVLVARLAGRYAPVPPSPTRRVARVATVTGVLTLLLALAGAAWFCIMVTSGFHFLATG